MTDELESSLTIMLIPDSKLKAVRQNVIDIHLTLAYFGKFTTGAPEPAMVRGALHSIAKAIGGPIPAVANAMGIFPDRDKFAVVDLVDGIGTFNARRVVEDWFGPSSLSKFKIDYTHGFTPHVTRSYMTLDQILASSPMSLIPDDPIEFTFDAIGVWHGHNHYELAL